jgi:hypothetical protein
MRFDAIESMYDPDLVPKDLPIFEALLHKYRPAIERAWRAEDIEGYLRAVNAAFAEATKLTGVPAVAAIDLDEFYYMPGRTPYFTKYYVDVDEMVFEGARTSTQDGSKIPRIMLLINQYATKIPNWDDFIWEIRSVLGHELIHVEQIRRGMGSMQDFMTLRELLATERTNSTLPDGNWDPAIYKRYVSSWPEAPAFSWMVAVELKRFGISSLNYYNLETARKYSRALDREIMKHNLHKEAKPWFDLFIATTDRRLRRMPKMFSWAHRRGWIKYAATAGIVMLAMHYYNGA